MNLSSEEKKHYSRHIILDEIGIYGQEKLKNARVLVIGAGGLGCPVLQYLTAAGVGAIGIIDDDVVDQTNLQRQILYTYDDIGSFKVTCAIRRLSKLNPHVNFEGYLEKLTTENAIDLFEKYDIIVDGSDNFPTRYLVNDTAVITNKPIVFASILKFEGQVSVFNYKNGPTYRCLYPNPPKEDEVPNCSQIGVLGVLPGIIGCFQANEVLKIICKLGGVLSGKLMLFDALTMQQNILNFSKNEGIVIERLQEDYSFFCGIDTSEITYATVLKNKSVYNLLDVRTVKERAEFNIGGLHIPLQELPSRINELDTSKKIVVYCKSGIRSQQAINFLKDEFDDIVFLNLKNGIFNLIEA